jgi:hypothetical protein
MLRRKVRCAMPGLCARVQSHVSIAGPIDPSLVVDDGNLIINVDVDSDVQFVVGNDTNAALFSFKSIKQTVDDHSASLDAQASSLASHSDRLDAHDAQLAQQSTSIQASADSIATHATLIAQNSAAIASNTGVDQQQTADISSTRSTIAAQSNTVGSTLSAMTVATTSNIRATTDPISTTVAAHASTLLQQSAIVAQNSIGAAAAATSLTNQLSTGDSTLAALNAATSSELRSLQVCTLGGSIYDFVSRTCIRPNFAFASVIVMWRAIPVSALILVPFYTESISNMHSKRCRTHSV